MKLFKEVEKGNRKLEKKLIDNEKNEKSIIEKGKKKMTVVRR